MQHVGSCNTFSPSASKAQCIVGCCTHAFFLSSKCGLSFRRSCHRLFSRRLARHLQAQDRCHRIGQTREVHIYRLVSESTIEENILHKSDQKRQLDHLAIQSGGFNTDFLQKFNPRELLGIQGDSLIV